MNVQLANKLCLLPIMLYQFNRIFTRYYSNILKLTKDSKMDKEKCYFRLNQNEEKVDINFLYPVKETNFRQFNFIRKPSESLESILNRVVSNIHKVVNKSNKSKSVLNPVNTLGQFLDGDGNEIDKTLMCIDLYSAKRPIKVKIFDTIFEVVFDPPWVLNLALPKSLLAGFPVYPEDLEMQNTEKDNTTFTWYSGQPVNDAGNKISDMHIKWKFLMSGFVCVPPTSAVGAKLKLDCLPGNKTTTGPLFDVMSSSVVEAGPGRCPFESRHLFTTSRLKEKSFRCVSYNILADLYCDSDFTRTVLHPYCPAYALRIDYRKQLILKELLGYNADIICLQEVDAKVFNNCLQPIMSANGFDCLFHKKGKEVAEGLACIYQNSRFGLLSEEKIVLSEVLSKKECFESIWNNVKDNKPLLERLLSRSTVASATVLQSLDNPDHIIVVGNTHLYFHPDADHIRLIQGGMCIYWLEDLVKKQQAQFPDKEISLILCGDFNSVPSCGIYQLYTTGSVDDSLPDWVSNEAEQVKGLRLSQSMQLGSACGTPEFTNYTAGFADCLDYVYYDLRSLEVEQVVPLPSVEELKANTALPSIVFPSDHIALVADLRFKT